MGLPKPVAIKCQKCGVSSKFAEWRTLNVSLNEEEKQKLLSGELTKFKCSCGWSGEAVYPMLYHDMERQLMIWLWLQSGDPEMDRLPGMGAAFMRKYQFRIVNSRNELVEKILIFDHRLDDRVLEIFKTMLLDKSGTNSPDGQFFFAGVTQLKEGVEVLSFDQLKKDGSVQSLLFSMEAYREAEEKIKAKLPPIDTLAGRWLRVGREFVGQK